MNRSICAALAALCVFSAPLPALAAQGEMGTGIPRFGFYTAASGLTNRIKIYELTNATIGFPASCPHLDLTPATMGADSFKAAIAMMMVARVTKTRIRFFAHFERDGGCGVDYVEVLD